MVNYANFATPIFLILTMNSKFLSIIIIFLSFTQLHSQSDPFSNGENAKYDTIKFISGAKQAAKIIEISDKYVKYKNPLDLNGPLFVVKKKNVERFILKDGCIDLKQQGFENCVKDPTYGIIEEREFKRKIISIDLFQLMNHHVQMNADFIFKNRRYGIGVFANKGFLDPTYYLTYEDRLETRILFAGGFYKNKYAGIDYKIFPYPHKKLTYFCSLGIDFGKANYMKTTIAGGYWSNTSSGYDFIPQYKKNDFYESVYIGYRFNNGFIWRLTPHFLCQGSITLGANHYNYYNLDDGERKNTILPKVTCGIAIGYAF
jgi:hypothetical protein